MNRVGIAALATLLWLALALAVDRLLLARSCPVCAHLLSLQLKVKLPAAEISYPPVSTLVLVVLPMLLLAIYLVPWRQMRSWTAWRAAFIRWCRSWLWLVIAVALTLLGESLYLMAGEYLPKAITALAEKVSVTATLSVSVPGFKEHTPLTLTASLAGFIGLLVGAYLFVSRGIIQTVK
jgi:hypothetical protein